MISNGAREPPFRSAVSRLCPSCASGVACPFRSFGGLSGSANDRLLVPPYTDTSGVLAAGCRGDADMAPEPYRDPVDLASHVDGDHSEDAGIDQRLGKV